MIGEPEENVCVCVCVCARARAHVCARTRTVSCTASVFEWFSAPCIIELLMTYNRKCIECFM